MFLTVWKNPIHLLLDLFSLGGSWPIFQYAVLRWLLYLAVHIQFSPLTIREIILPLNKGGYSFSEHKSTSPFS